MVKRNKYMNVPEIRFKGLDKTWNKKTLDKLVQLNSGMDYKHLCNGNIPVYGTGGYMLSVNAALSYDKDAIGIGRKGTINKPYILKAPFWTVDTLFYAIPRKYNNLQFCNCIFQRIDWLKYDESTGVPSLSKNIINSIEVNCAPSYDEQQKIASYFQSLDSLIQTTSKELTSLKQIKAASLQSMFPQEGETVPEVRFKGFEGEWNFSILKDFSKKITEKNRNRLHKETFTNSAELGVVSQRTYFDHDISNNENINGYYVIHPDDFVYNPRISVTAPVGPINRNLLNKTGIMSPLYCIFSVNNINKTYLEYFFKTNLWHKYIYINGNAGARFDRLSITDENFFNMPILTPSTEEQQKIASYFCNLDKQISLQTQRLEKLKQIKAACLDKMFV